MGGIFHSTPKATPNEIGRRIVAITTAIAGLLIVKVAVDHLPMLTHAQPMVARSANPQTTAYMRRFLRSYTANGGPIPARYQANFYLLRNVPLARVIFPVSIANAVIDTIIFAIFLYPWGHMHNTSN